MGRPTTKLGQRAFEKGWTMRKLAEHCGMSYTKLIDAARGRATLTRREAVAIYSALEVER